MLCKWRYNGIITAAQQAAALVNVGWAPADALRIVKECEREIAEKEAKAAAKAAQDAAKAVKQAEKEAAASRKKSLDEAKEFARRNGRNGVPASAGP
jgi:vacuolar-type H+-ATPase subunit E/Vma4